METSLQNPQPQVSGSLIQVIPQPIQYVPYAVPTPAAVSQGSGLGVAVRTMGIIALCLMVVGLIPCFGWVNYFNIAFGIVTLVLSIVALASAPSDSARTSAIIGLVLVVVADFAGVVRLILGGGCL